MSAAEAAISRLRKLYQLGQSPWYDNIDRRLIANGGLKALFDQGIVGVTSNPTIFEKAINGSDVYDAKIKKLKADGLDLVGIYDELTADDVRDAADLLSDVYEKSRHVDGYVSIEVLPSYAHDAARTIEYGRSIFKKVGRPNVMVKVPGTKESPEAIRALIREGINVNVTLLFSVSQYEHIAEAYWGGLREAIRLGQDASRIASVASVFISRIDSKIDHLIDAFAERENDLNKREAIRTFKGKAAVANAKMIYQAYKDFFKPAKFMELHMSGGRPQRVLWASTSTKNPAYSDCLYVDQLIGPMTVNTIPHATVLAFQDHGKPSLTLEAGLDEAHRALNDLENMGISLERICDEAQVEGVKAFEQSFETLMKSLAAKAQA